MREPKDVQINSMNVNNNMYDTSHIENNIKNTTDILHIKHGKNNTIQFPDRYDTYINSSFGKTSRNHSLTSEVYFKNILPTILDN